MLALVTDSTCALSREEAERLGVTVVPTTFAVDGYRHPEGFLGENMDYASLFSKGRHVMTEAVRTSAFESVFREHVAAGDDVLCVTISSRLSGTFRSAEEAAASFEGEGGPRVVAFDSWVTAGALEFTVRRARDLANEGRTLDEVVEGLKAFRGEAHVVFSVADMDALHQSGRLGAFRRSVATKLNRYPVMGLRDGAIVEIGMGRGAHGLGTMMVSQVPEGVNDLVISCFGRQGVEAREVLLAAKARFPQALVRVKDGGPVLAKNLGIGAVGLSWA